MLKLPRPLEGLRRKGKRRVPDHESESFDVQIGNLARDEQPAPREFADDPPREQAAHMLDLRRIHRAINAALETKQAPHAIREPLAHPFDFIGRQRCHDLKMKTLRRCGMGGATLSCR